MTNAASIPELILGLMRGDGAVVYLNGNEFHRSNMPVGDIRFSTPAVSPSVADAHASGLDGEHQTGIFDR